MTLSLDLPRCKPSFLQRLDPRWKLAGVLIGGAAVALLRAWGPAVAALLLTILLVLLARLPLRWYLRRLGGAGLLVAILMIWAPFIPAANDTPIELGFITLWHRGLLRFVLIGAKFGAMISLVLVVLATAPLHDTFKAAHSLRIPGLFIQLVLLTYRYVLLVLEEFGRLRIALRVRGFRGRADLRTYGTVGRVAGTLLARSHERSERVAQAMRCRGFDGQFRSLHEFRTTWRDVLGFVVMAGMSAALVSADWCLRVS